MYIKVIKYQLLIDQQKKKTNRYLQCCYKITIQKNPFWKMYLA